MSIVTRARKSFRLIVISVIISAMLAVAAPAHAQLFTITSSNDIATGIGGDGGNGGIAAAVSLLNCFSLIDVLGGLSCGDAGAGGASADGGPGAPGIGITSPDTF